MEIGCRIWIWIYFFPEMDVMLSQKRKKCLTAKHTHQGLIITTFFFSFSFFGFLGPHSRHMGVLRLGIGSELQLPAYATITAMQYPSHVCDLHHSSWQRWILNLLSKEGQGLNPKPHGYQSDLFLLCHNGNSITTNIYNTNIFSLEPLS